jgi:hypothetical protein
MVLSVINVNLEWLDSYLMRDRPKLLTDIILGSGFYMFLARTEPRPLYIGQAYYESIRSRITSHRPYTAKIGRWAFDHGVSIEEVEYKVAYFVSDDKTLYRDVENLLVYFAQPILNVEFKDAYRGRKLRIHNKGKYEPLEADMISP